MEWEYLNSLASCEICLVRDSFGKNPTVYMYTDVAFCVHTMTRCPIVEMRCSLMEPELRCIVVVISRSVSQDLLLVQKLLLQKRTNPVGVL